MGYGDDVGTYVSSGTVLQDLGWLLPGLYESVKCPNSMWDGAPRLAEGRTYCNEHYTPIVSLVQHLNDSCGWEREEVADWLETLDVDLTFPTEPPPRPEPLIEATASVLPDHDSETCQLCLAYYKGMKTGKKFGKVLWLDVETTDLSLSFDGSNWLANYVVIDDFTSQLTNYPKTGKFSYSIGYSLDAETEEEKQFEKLKAARDTPSLLRRPDKTMLPTYDRESFLKTKESFPRVALFPGALKHLETEYPTSKDNLNLKGKRRGRHRRT